MAKRVLFVCVENSNRSQMAEAFARMQGRQGFGLVVGGNHDSEQVSIHRRIVAGASRSLT
jgi:protein-tyrosine-phosphatase